MNKIHPLEKNHQKNRYNVILITLDSFNFNLFIDNLESLPNLKKLKEKGVFFEAAFSISTSTAFSFPGIIGGIYPYGFGTVIDENIKTIDSLLAEHGYNTAFINESNAFLTPFFGYCKSVDYSKHFLELSHDKMDRKFKSVFLKRADNRARDHLSFKQLEKLIKSVLNSFPMYLCKFVRFFYNLCNFIELYLSENNFQERKKLHEAFRNEILDFINERFKKPQFLWIHTTVNHLPYFPPDDSVSHSSERKINYLNYRGLSNFINRRVAYELKSLYIESLKTTDKLIGNIIETLEVKGFLDDSIIVITADHGEEFMEEAHFGHDPESSSDRLLHVPLLFYCPDMFESNIISLPVSTIDILPTVTNLLDFQKPNSARGISLKRILLKDLNDLKERGKFWRRPIYSEAWQPEDFLDRSPGYKSNKRIFTVRKGKFKLRVKEELKNNVLTKKFYLVDWVTMRKVDIRKNNLIFEELRNLLYEHISKEILFCREIHTKAEKEKIRKDEKHLTRKNEERVKNRLRALGYID